VFLKFNGVQCYLWRTVDQQGAVIDILVQPKRNRFAAMRFFRKLLQSSRRRPRVIITDKLRKLRSCEESSGAASRSSTEPIPEQSSRELASPNPTTKRHLVPAAYYQAERQGRFETWQQIIAA